MRSLLTAVLTVALVTSARPALASPDEDIDTEAAHRHFDLGHMLYERGQYAEARDEFLTARSLRDLPAFDYNLAKCEERLEHWQRAIDAYEQYLGRSTGTAADKDVRERIAILKRRLAVPPGVEAPLPRSGRLRDAAIGVGAGAVLLGGIGAGVYYASWGAYDACRATPCTPAQRSSLGHRVHTDEVASFTLLATAGVAAIVDVALWIDWARRHRPRTMRSTP